jgi:hypothetical protein
MRNLLLAGTAGLFVALGGASAYAVPASSPYATMVPPAAVDGYVPPAPLVVERPARLYEGRSAYIAPDGTMVGPARVVGPAYVAPPPAVVYERRAYAPFPFDLLPWNW